MKRTLFCAAVTLIAAVSFAQPTGVQLTEPVPGLEYYLPAGASGLNAGVPTPEAALGYNFGEKFPEWADVINYMHVLENVSDRVSLKYFGKTYEGRPFVQLTITSPKNQARLEEIRKEHLALTDASSGSASDLKSMPLIVNLMGSIHGNEISGVTGLLPVAYYYTASNDPEVMKILDETVIVITPGLNPDGINRFAHWINANSSLNHYFTPESREYDQVAPRSRSNHYWMDCNRDWLAARFDVGRNCVEMYKYWMPNVILDLHEMGSKGKIGTYYFSPGDPRRTYQYTPQENQDLTLKISDYTGEALSSIGTKYFTRCNYDDFFIGKGAAYCDIQGGIGILHEQCSTRGHIAEFEKHGIFTFFQTVRNQSYSSYAVVKGSYELRDEIKTYFRSFYENASKAASADASKAYVFGLKDDRGSTFEFIDNLRLHDIDVYRVKGEEGRYAVPLDQKHYYLAKCIFEDIREYADSTFYDISTWSQSRAFGVDASLVTKPGLGDRVEKAALPAGTVEEMPETVAYAFVPSEYYAPFLMSALQSKGVSLKVATSAFIYRTKKTKTVFPAGTVVIPTKDQMLGPDEMLSELKRLCTLCGVDVKALGAQKKFDFASLNLEDVRKPRVAIIGPSQEAGAVWFLMDRRFGIEHAVINAEELAKKDFKFGNYNMIVLHAAAPSAARPGLAGWVRNGGTLFLVGEARKTTSGKVFGLPGITGTEGLPMAGKGVRGVVLQADVKDSTSPLLWGYSRAFFDLMKAKAGFWTVPEGYNTVLEWNSEPFRSGCISSENVRRMADAPVLVTKKSGKGTIIYADVDFNYRSYWLSTSHIISNAAFFGDRIH